MVCKGPLGGAGITRAQQRNAVVCEAPWGVVGTNNTPRSVSLLILSLVEFICLSLGISNETPWCATHLLVVLAGRGRRRRSIGTSP